MPGPFSSNGEDPRRASITFAPLDAPQGPGGNACGETISDTNQLLARVARGELSLRQLRAELGRRVRQQGLIDRITRLSVAVGEAGYDAKSCDDFTRAAVEALCEGLGADAVYLLELVAEDVAFRVRAYAGRAIDTYGQHKDATPDSHPHLAARAETAAGWALRSNRVIRVEDYTREERFQREIWPGQSAVHSAINVRIQAQKEPFGVLVAQSDTRNQFSQADSIFVRTLANLLSQSLACARNEHHQRRKYAEFRRTMSAREEALSIISHDLRSPATTVSLSLEVLRRSLTGASSPLPPELIERAVSKAHAGINRMMAMMDELLAMNRAEGDTFNLVREPVDLRVVIETVLHELADLIETSGSVLCVEGPGSLVGNWDRIRLEQMVSNLVSNAIKYGEGGAISLRLKRCDSRAYFIVRDEGVGIAVEDQSRIFDRFIRVRSAQTTQLSTPAQNQRDSNSYGLGLWIVKRVVEALDGSIRLESSPGVGSTFTVELPLDGE